MSAWFNLFVAFLYFVSVYISVRTLLSSFNHLCVWQGRGERKVYWEMATPAVILPQTEAVNPGVCSEMWIGGSFSRGWLSDTIAGLLRPLLSCQHGTKVTPVCVLCIGSAGCPGMSDNDGTGTADDGSRHVRQLSKFTSYTAMFSW